VRYFEYMEDTKNNMTPSDNDIVVLTSSDREVEFQVVVFGQLNSR